MLRGDCEASGAQHCVTERRRSGDPRNSNGKKRLTEKAFRITITQGHLRGVELLP
jgi:hypothetical protein